LRGTNTSQKFDQSVTQISGILEQARGYAVAQNTYVWVALYENAAGGPHDVYAAAFTSSDGSDPFNWAGSVTVPPGTFGTTTITEILRTYHFSGLHLQTTTMPNGPTSPSLPAALPGFQITVQGSSGPVTLSAASTTYYVIQFTPSGAVHDSTNTIDSIWFGMQPSLSSTILDTKNIASIKVDGLTGSNTIYRE